MDDAQAAAESPDISVVVVTFDVLDKLQLCVRSLQAALSGMRSEVTVVDNGYGDGSWSWLLGLDQVRVIRGSPARGFGAAVNQGLASSQGRYFLVLNPDTLLPPESIRQLVNVLDSAPDVGLVGPKLVLNTGELDRASRRSFPTPVSALARMLRLDVVSPKSSRFGQYNLTYLDPDQAVDVDAVSGAFMLWRSDAFREVEGFDEGFWMYGEDLDICLRVRESGWRVRYQPDVKVLHEKGASSSTRPLRTRYEFYRAMARFYNKHHASRRSPIVNTAVLVAIVALGGLAVGKEFFRQAMAVIFWK